MKNAIDVVKDRNFRYFLVQIVVFELGQCPVSDVIGSAASHLEKNGINQNIVRSFRQRPRWASSS